MDARVEFLTSGVSAMRSFVAAMIVLVSAVSGCGQPDAAAPGASGGAAPGDAVSAGSDQPADMAADTDATATDAVSAGNATAATAPVASGAGEVELAIVSFDELKAFIGEQKGKVVIVDYWSTQCPPCIQEFPHLIELSRKYPASQLVCVSASLDYEGLPSTPVEASRDSALEFLKEKQATIHNVIFREDSQTIFDEKLKIGSIPAVEVYDVDGAIRQRFDDSQPEPFGYEKSITPLIEQLIAERFPAATE